MATIPNNEIDQASLQRLALNFYREALRGNIDFGGGSLPDVTDEQIEDAVAAMIAAGTQSGVVITYDDTAGSLSFNVTAGGDLSGLSTNAIPVKGTSGDLEDSGLQRLSDGTILAPRQFGVESGSVDFGDLVRLSESSGFLSILNKATDSVFNLIDHAAPSDAESSAPRYLHLTEAENDFVIFSDDSEMITATDITMQYTTQLLARTNAFKLRSSAATTNVRFAVTDVASGVVVKYFPSKAAWLSGEGGVDLVSGENTLDLGDTPMVLDPNRALSIEFESDTSTLLGDADTSTPYLAAVVQRGEFRDLFTTGDGPTIVGILEALTGADRLNASAVEVDASTFDGHLGSDVTDVQRLAQAVDDLPLSGGGANPNRFGGPIVPFVSDVTVNSGNFDTYDDAIALYVRPDNRLTTFNLPSIETINGRYPAVISILHQGGTDRDAGTTFNPSNRVRVPDPDADGMGLIRPPATNLQFHDVRQNDFATFVRMSEDTPWVVTNATLTTGALLLPDGLFNLKAETVFFRQSLGFITGIPTGFVPQAGDAYKVGNDDDEFGGYGVQTDDVIVALVDNPSRVLSETNDDWLLIRNASNNTITLQEMRFLNQVTEVDSFSDSQLEGRSDVQNVRVFLSTGILDHAPFINPSTDPNNPQVDGVSYVGGDELDGDGFDFRSTSNLPQSLLYLDIDGSFDAETNTSDVHVLLKDRDGQVVEDYNLEDHFRTATLSGSSDTYYILDHFPNLQDNYSSINYINGYSIEVVYRATTRQFDLNSSVNVLPSIADGEIPLAKLEPNAQALIHADHSLSAEEQAKLDGLQTGGTPTDWTAGELLAKLSDDAHPSNDIDSYHDVGQQNGLLGQFGRTTEYTFLVPNFVNVTGLERQDDTSIKLPVTRIGTILGRQAFTATLPASSFDINNPVGDAWIVDGQATNLELTGADDSFKIGRNNLSDSLSTWIQNQAPDNPTPVALPENLQQFSRHLTINTDTTSGWTEVEPKPIRADLSRQFAALWDEDRRTFTGNYFEDITDVDVVGFQGNNIFYYPTPTDSHNTIFQGAQSYILNSNVRIRNTSGGSEPISEEFNKIISFNYAIDFARIGDDTTLNMLRVGPTASTAAISISGEEGLFLNIGRGDGGQRSRTYDVFLPVFGGHWHDRVDEVEAAEAEVEVPDDLTGSLQFTISIQLDNNGNDEGTHQETITIDNVGTDQNLGQRTFDFAGYPSVTLDITYDAVNNDLSNPRRIVLLRPTQPFNNPALTYNVSAVRHVTESWNVPTTYARRPINAGDAHDDFGLFDPHLWETEQLNHRNRVLLAFSKYREGDTDADPEMAVTVIVDGQLENNGNPIRLHRPASDFTFDDMSFGNNNVGIAHIQVYDYDGPTPSGPELQRLYAHQADWLGAFWPAGHAVDDIVLDAHIEATAGHGIILTDTSDSSRKLLEIDNGSVIIKNI